MAVAATTVACIDLGGCQNGGRAGTDPSTVTRPDRRGSRESDLASTPVVGAPPSMRSSETGQSESNGDPVELWTAAEAWPVSARRSPHDVAINTFGEVDGARGAWGQFGASESIAQVSFAIEGADFGPRVNHTGDMLLYASTQHSRSADIYKKSIDGRTVTQLTDDPADDMMPVWSPDDSRIAFTSNRNGNWDIYIMDADGGAAVQVTFDPAHQIHPSWSPDGRYLVYSKRGETSGRWEMWMTEVGATNVRRFLDYGLFPEWSPDPSSNQIVYQKARERGSRYFSIWTIEVVNGEGRAKTEIVGAVNAACINPTWSPDGAMIAFATITNPDRLSGNRRPDFSDIWVIRQDGTDRVQLTSGQYANLQPTWGPDGRIYFVSDRNGVENIWAIAPARAILTASWPDPYEPAIANVPTDDDAQ